MSLVFPFLELGPRNDSVHVPRPALGAKAVAVAKQATMTRSRKAFILILVRQVVFNLEVDVRSLLALFWPFFEKSCVRNLCPLGVSVYLRVVLAVAIALEEVIVANLRTNIASVVRESITKSACYDRRFCSHGQVRLLEGGVGIHEEKRRDGRSCRCDLRTRQF